MRIADVLHLLRTRLRESSLEVRDRPERLMVYVLAALGAAVSLKEAYDAFGVAAIGLAALALLGFVALLMRHRPAVSGSLPSGDVRSAPYRLHLPPSVDTVKTIIRKCQKIFHGDAIDPDEDLGYFLADPYSIVALDDSEGHCLGFIDFYFFDPPTFDRYLRGELTFDEALHSGFLPHPQAREARVVYVGTHVHFGYASDGQDFWRSRENALLVWGAAQLLLRVQTFGPDGLDMYSTAWSSDGAGILQHLYFSDSSGELVARGGRLGDKPLYRRLHVTREDLAASVQRFDGLAARHCEVLFEGTPVEPPSGGRVPAAPAARRRPARARP